MFCRMDAAANVSQRGTSAAVPSIALRDTVFLELTAKLGAASDVARARLLDVDRATISRMRTGKFLPRLELAMRMADRLGTTVDELFESVSA
jgi:DNA-binding XRE family transcriptional regulator